MGLREGADAYLLSIPVKAPPPVCFLWRSDSSRKHLSVPQEFPTSGTVLFLFLPHLDNFQKDFLL